MLTTNKTAVIQTNPNDLSNIVAKATYLSELLSNPIFENDISNYDENQANEYLKRWCQVVAAGNWQKFEKRLRWQGWDLDSVRLRLGQTADIPLSALPKWAETLQSVMYCAASVAVHNSNIASDRTNQEDAEELPFEHILYPAVEVARQKLLARLGIVSLSFDCQPLNLLTEKAYLTLEQNLLFKLAELCKKTLVQEFSESRAFGQDLLNMLGISKSTPSQVRYYEFVHLILQDGMLAFFQKYPVLGRMVATTIDFWVEAIAEFLIRLQADLPTLEQVFQPQQLEGAVLGKVTEFQLSLSDPHNQGRSVMVLTFESGLNLVYKPKNMGLESAYNQFLDWCNQNGVPLTFKVLQVIDCDSYGWVEYVSQQSCRDAAAAERFYQRAGMLMCLLYVLRCTDCHRENLIACGEHLTLVDMETLFHPEPKFMSEVELINLTPTNINGQFWDSVLRTGLLPSWKFSGERQMAYDISALGSVEEQQAPRRQQFLKAINTDDMHFAYETFTMPIDCNVPMLDGVVLSPNDYLDKLLLGFEKMYQFLLQKQSILLADEGLLSLFQKQRVRFIFRNTYVYAVILEKSFAPEFLQSGINRSIKLDTLSKAFLTLSENYNPYGILQAELRAMEQLDVPYFETVSDSDMLPLGFDIPSIESFFQAPSYKEVVAKLQVLTPQNLAQQMAIIRGVFHARVVRKQSISTQTSPFVSFTQTDYTLLNPLTPEQLLQQAQSIAIKIAEQAFTDPEGRVDWIGLGFQPVAERYQFQPLEANLYDGKAGVALFLSALDWITGKNDFRDLILGALDSVRYLLYIDDSEIIQRWGNKIGIGGSMGLGSLMYSLVKMSQFLEEASLLEDAKRIAEIITDELIATDQKLDLMLGSAGTILGLLTLYNQQGDEDILQRAIACGQHLLKTREAESPRAWKTLKTIANKPLTGFSHGAAGFAYALLRLYKVTQDNSYLEAAIEAIAYERSVYCANAGNWPDFRFSKNTDQSQFMTSWCHGASGIGLARLGGLEILDTDAIRQDIEIALQRTQSIGIEEIDHLCCGNFGRVEVLLIAAEKLARPELRILAHKQAAGVVAKAEQTGGYQLFFGLKERVFNPGFCVGVAGIGYELLRLAYPQKLPSVLLWE
jgi:type 2 lantibiotic biosynthesis protein LanM